MHKIPTYEGMYLLDTKTNALGPHGLGGKHGDS